MDYMYTKRSPQLHVAERSHQNMEDAVCSAPTSEELASLVTVCIKTFLRPETVTRCVRSVVTRLPGVRVLVCDDSDGGGLLPEEAEVICLPFDSGVSRGRNMLADMVTTPFLLQLDDDMVLTEDTDVLHALRILSEDLAIDLVGGVVVDDADEWAMAGSLTLTDGTLVIRKGATSGTLGGGQPRLDLVNSCICRPAVGESNLVPVPCCA